MQGCLLSSSTVGILAVDGSHVRDADSTLSQLLLPVWSCSGAESANLGVRGHLNRTRVEATRPWLASASSAAVERSAACSVHAAVCHIGAGVWAVNAIVIARNLQGDATAPLHDHATITHAVLALSLPFRHSHLVTCSVTLARCSLRQLPCGVRAVGAVRLIVSHCTFTNCDAGVEHVMTSRAMQRSTQPPHSTLLPAAWVCTLEVRDSVFDARGGSSACGVRCRWLCLIERLRPGARPSPTVETPQQQQPLLPAIFGDGSSSMKGSEPSSNRVIGVARHMAPVAPVVIDGCSFTASAVEFIGSVSEFPATFAQPLSLTFHDVAAEASAWCAKRARADSAWAAAAVSRCTFNAEAPESSHGKGCEVVLSVPTAHAAAAPSVAFICVHAAADIALSLRDCVFAATLPTRHAVAAAPQPRCIRESLICDALSSGGGDCRRAAHERLQRAVCKLRGRGAVGERQRASRSRALQV